MTQANECVTVLNKADTEAPDLDRKIDNNKIWKEATYLIMGRRLNWDTTVKLDIEYKF